jgi:hypothetical protein
MDCQICDAALFGRYLGGLQLPVREIVYHFCVPRLFSFVCNFELQAAPLSSCHICTVLGGWAVDLRWESLNSSHLLQNLLPCRCSCKNACKPLPYSGYVL